MMDGRTMMGMMRRRWFTRLVRLWTWLLILVSSEICLQATIAQSIVFKEVPEEVTANTSAAFWFSVVGSDGSNPCVDPCAIQCQLDVGSYRDCVGGRDSYANLLPGSHSFSVWANTSGGSYLSTVYRWTVDNTPPTAAIDAGPVYTNAVNLTVFVRFSKNCSTGGTFQCVSVSSCDLLVYGPGIVVPSTLKILTPGLEYSIQVVLSTESPTGKVTITTARSFCSDTVGNPYQRTSNSTVVIRFSRLLPTVNIWTAIKNSQITIRNQSRTIQTTNNTNDLHIYLDFTDPVNVTVGELQRLLNLTSGTLLPTQRKSRGNRRFGFLLTLNDTGASTPVTVSLPGNTTFSRYGNPVADTTSVCLLYDNKRPQVQLSTTARAHTRDQILPVTIQFTKPVFLFNSSDVTLTGGILRSFNEVSKTTYALVVFILEGSTAKISVAENQTLDVAGNPNVASVVLQVTHYDVPAVSVALSFFITAGLLGTTIASGALALASANLASAGAFSSQTGCVGADPSRNLLGMAGHMQIFALSEFLAVSLPIEYFETARGLRWLVPHVNTPWQRDADADNFTNFGKNVSTTDVAVSLRPRSLLMAVSDSASDSEAPARFDSTLQHFSSQFAQRHIFKWHKQRRGNKCNTNDENSPSNCSTCTYLRNLFLVNSSSKHEDFQSFELWRRQLGANGTEFGPSLSQQEYEMYFVDPNLQALKSELNASIFTGWRDFQRNMFWLAVVGGGLTLWHILTILFLKWRSKTALYGALTFPRFELFLLLLALPAICQASAFIIRGGTRTGIIVGVILLAIPTLFFLAVATFLIHAVLVRKIVQYKELRPTTRRSGVTPPPPTGRPLSLFVGEGYQGKWVRAEGDINPGIVPSFGILFEDRKGPPRLVSMINNNENINLRKQGLGRNGLRRIRTMNSDDEIDESSVSWAYHLLGCFQSSYILIDLGRRIALGVIFGAYRVSDESWSQVALGFALTVFQFLYLVIVKPFHRRGVQLVESLSLLCEVGVFAAALAILASNYRPQENHTGVGIVMLVLLVFSFVVQSANEWFALIRQLLSLSNSEEISPTLGLREFVVGLILPFIPRSQWSKVVTLMVQGTQTVARRPRLAPTPQPNMELDQRPSSSGQQHQQPGYTTAASVHRSVSPGTHNDVPAGFPSPILISSEDYWPGGDLQQWRRQNSLERKRQESETVGSSLTQEIFVVDEPSGKSRPVDFPSMSGGGAGGRSWPRRNHRVHSSDSLSDFTPSDGEVITPDVSQELKGSGVFGSAAMLKELNVPHSSEIKPAPLPQCFHNVRVG